MSEPIGAGYDRPAPELPCVELEMHVRRRFYFASMAEAQAWAEAQAGEPLVWGVASNEGGQSHLYSSGVRVGGEIIGFSARPRD